LRQYLYTVIKQGGDIHGTVRETLPSVSPPRWVAPDRAVPPAPTFRRRYAEFLKIDFPHLPLTSDVTLFRNLCALGKELVALHLMETLPKLKTSYPVAGDNTVDHVRSRQRARGV
jgi:hypothetical protein